MSINISQADKPIFETASQRLVALRRAMSNAHVQGYLIPHGDEHQGEFIAPYAERLKWLTGFTGSAGIAIVLDDQAVIFVDGRYTLQVKDQVDGGSYEFAHLIDEPPGKWLEQNLSKDSKLGFDPHLHTPAGLTALASAVEKSGAELMPIAKNLIDEIWVDQPSHPAAPVSIYPETMAGRSSGEKRSQIAKVLKSEGMDAFLFSALDSIAWLFNIRGADVAYSPLSYAYALLFADGAALLFIKKNNISKKLSAHLSDEVTILPYQDVGEALQGLSSKVKVIGVDQTTASSWVVDLITQAKRLPKHSADPCTAQKACKHPVELEGVRQAHIRDGVALTRFLAWLALEGPKGELSESDAAERLESFRAENSLFLGPSFPTIAGAGANGAVVHYHALPDTASIIKPDMLFLVDSGGQYLDGTTDVTRTVAIGVPTSEQKRRFTLVLKGHIALARARFVAGISGSQLDTLARMPLWEEGLDFDHGTGHGVGTYLGVHEGPQSISKRANNVALKPNMVISNEPGYYKSGEYGIRIENLVAVVEAKAPYGSERQLLEFETVTLAPIDLNLVDSNMLTTKEKAWLNTYHFKVRESLCSFLDLDTRSWLETVTRKVS
ncbi:MAG: X-Pro aminopeptidase [Candidatus Marinimicrobia bacterium]|nr:X-Pro aminopeptidase [Candidatus Neomarinimicrobiota bacterium]